MIDNKKIGCPFLRDKLLLELFGPKEQSESIPKGIGVVFENLYEIQSLVKSLLALKNRDSFYRENYFFTAFFISCTYSTALLARQLFSRDNRDHSLKRMWQYFFTEDEKKKFHSINNFIFNEVETDLRKLNKNILHNEINNMPDLVAIVDKFLNNAAEIIGLISEKGNCHIRPPKTNEVAFECLNMIFEDEEIKIMKNTRKQYLNELLQKTNHPTF